jgi:uncharacterized protein YuzE
MSKKDYKKLRFDYDKESDVLYAFWDKPEPAICSEEIEGILIRRRPGTKKVVGFTIYNYSLRKKKLKIPYFPNLRIPC